MKLKHLLTALALLIAGISTNAQVNLGVKAGYDASWIPGTVVYGYEKVLPHSNFYAGASCDFILSGNWIGQAELIYSGKGHYDKSNVDNHPYKRDIGYLQIPLYAGYRTSDGKFAIMAGPEPGIMLYSKTTEFGASSDSTKECNRFNIAVAVQLNYMFTDNLGADIKFDFGCNRTFNGKFIDLQDDKGHNLSVELGLCYKFEL